MDDGLNIVLFACIGVGVFRATGDPLALAAGFVAAALHVGYDVVAYRELKIQGGGGEIIKVHWRLTGRSDMKTRDFFILAFLVYGLLGVPWLALIHALLIAGSLAVVAGAQVVWRARGGR